jgi:hypothetical protein
VFKGHFNAQADAGVIAKSEVKAHVDNGKNLAYLLNMIGAGAGMWLFTKVAAATGRRTAFAIGFTAALVVTAYAYWKMETPTDAYWMMPLMGAAQLGPFAGFAIYLPELFPGSLRSTGTSFCYNLGRFAAAGGSFFSAYLTKLFATGDPTSSLPLRYSAITMCAIFLVGLPRCRSPRDRGASRCPSRTTTPRNAGSNRSRPRGLPAPHRPLPAKPDRSSGHNCEQT